MLKRISALTLVLIMCTALFAGCGSKETTSSPSASPAESAAPVEKTVVAGINADYTTFDPANVYEKSAHMIMHSLYETLVQFDADTQTKIVPGAAESWTISEDKLTYTFKLREDIVASTGKPLNATDAAFAILRTKNLKGNPSFLADPIKDAVATGDYELTITLNEVTPSILAVLTESAFSLYDSDVAKANGATGDPTTDTAQAYFDKTSIGSGAFVLTSYTPNAELIMTKSPTYTGTAAKLDKVIFKHMNDSSMQLISLQKGDIDFAFDLTSDQITTLSQNNVVVNTYPTLDVFTFQMNVDKTIGGPLANEDVRKAIYYAVDYDGLCQLAGNDATTPYNIIPDGFAGYLGVSEIKRDLEKAKQLLTDAGYPDGFTIQCGVIPEMAPDGVSFMDCAVKIQADLAEVGIKLEIQSDEVSVYLEKLRGGQYQSCVGMWGPDYLDPASQLAFLPGETVGLRSNWTAEMSPELAELCAQAKVEVDTDARAEIFKQIQQKYTETAGPILIYLQPNRALAMSTRVTDVVYTPSYMLDFNLMDVQ